MKKFSQTICVLLLVLMAMMPTAASSAKKWLGGDISMLPALQQRGAQYADIVGRSVDPYALFKQQGWNMMRVRLFVEPARANSQHRDEGVCQDLPYVIDLCRDIKRHGFKVMLDFHYSDTWADPAKQFMPQRWAGVDERSVADSVYRYTREALLEMKKAGVTPDMIQVGNEITNGMVWPLGRIDPSADDGWDVLLAMLHQGVKACREVCPKAKLIIHTEKAGVWPITLNYYEHIEKARLDYDIIGLSYYPMWHGTIENLGATLDSLAARFPKKPVMIVEAAYYYLHDGRSWGGDEDFTNCPPGTIEGQRQFTAQLVSELKRHKNVTGLFWWFPEENNYGTGARRGLNRGLFDNRNGHALPALYELRHFK